MPAPTIQQICDAIWQYETRTLLDGDPLASPTTTLEVICDECWTYETRTLTSEPPVTYRPMQFMVC
jgi:hypothetical protein